MEELLSYSHVDIAFRGNTVVHDVSFELHPGEILGIVGESGSGKSTLLKAAMGLLGRDGMVTRGDIFFHGQDIPDLPEKQLRTRNRHDLPGCGRFVKSHTYHWCADPGEHGRP